MKLQWQVITYKFVCREGTPFKTTSLSFAER